MNSKLVKVKMEGVMIGRKIDVMLFDSYQSLTGTLLNMFTELMQLGENEEGAYEYVIHCLDKDGEWRFAKDVPWQTLIESVQWMEILKRSRAT